MKSACRPDHDSGRPSWEQVHSFSELVRYAGDTLPTTALASGELEPPSRACNRVARWLLGGLAESGESLETSRTQSLARELQYLSRACATGE